MSKPHTGYLLSTSAQHLWPYWAQHQLSSWECSNQQQRTHYCCRHELQHEYIAIISLINSVQLSIKLKSSINRKYSITPPCPTGIMWFWLTEAFSPFHSDDDQTNNTKTTNSYRGCRLPDEVYCTSNRSNLPNYWTTVLVLMTLISRSRLLPWMEIGKCQQTAW